nr:unnamed protein product [Callosobruchus chinensis]
MTEKWSDRQMRTWQDFWMLIKTTMYCGIHKPSYRNQQARQAALQAILEHVNKPKVSESDLKNKIKNI